MRIASSDTCPRFATMIAPVCWATTAVVTLNVTTDCPPAKDTPFGMDTAELVVVREACKPPGGAIPLKVRVPTEVEPPATAGGLNVSDTKMAGTIVKVALSGDSPFKFAETVATVLAVTLVVGI